MTKSDGADHVKTALRMSIMNERVLQNIVREWYFLHGLPRSYNQPAAEDKYRGLHGDNADHCRPSRLARFDVSRWYSYGKGQHHWLVSHELFLFRLPYLSLTFQSFLLY